jgi:LytS/YehU family sensor histidine kinase
VFGNKSVRPAHVQFTILPEWYQLLWLRWLAAMVFFALAVFVSVRYAMASEKRKRLQSELKQTISRLELEAIHLQINPHFIFNCLNAIQNAIHKNNTERASYFINRFAKLMRKALMLSKESFITIDEEYSFINNYLEVEQLRHNGAFDYRVEIDPGLDANATYVPAFILQTFIENSINHGVRYLKGEKGEIVLRFVKTDKLEIHLDDNGIGIVASKVINQNSLSQHSSKGLELMHARVDSLNKLYHRNIEIRITDKSERNKEEHGTEVVISLNLS